LLARARKAGATIIPNVHKAPAGGLFDLNENGGKIIESRSSVR